MAQKVLTWSNINWIIVHIIFTFHVYFSSCTCTHVRIRFRYKRCDICVDLHMIYNYIVENGRS